MRRDWKSGVLLIAMFAIFWILVLPQVDLDPATPLTHDAVLFLLIAISFLVGASFMKPKQPLQAALIFLPSAQAPPTPSKELLPPLRI